MNIITITLNPAFDIHYEIEDFKPYKENYVSSILISAGGKGINVSRALLENNIDNTAYVILGRENASDFVSRLEKEGFKFKAIYCEGRIRENITIHSSEGRETRISQDNFYLPPDILDKLLEELKKFVDENTILVFSGRIPKGLSTDRVISFLQELRAEGCLLAVDSNSFSMEELVCIRPWLIKPNEQEIETLIGSQVNTIEEAKEAAIEIHGMGIDNVIVSMGKEGAAMASAEWSGIVKAPSILPVSTIGAGDSMIAGFIGAYVQGVDKKGCLKNAVAFGTAACLTEGTAPPRCEDIQRIKQMMVERG